MKAGRELDALIAERVMGEMWGVGPNLEDTLPHFSTQIADAWLVVDKLGEMGWYVTLFRTRCYWKVVLGHYPYEAVPEIKKHNPETHEGIGPYIEAPLAICLAALKAVE